MKMRTDLTSSPMTYQGVEYWVVKEPLGQKYYQFPPHVFWLLEQLDGEQSIESLMEEFHRIHSPKRITRNELQQLLTRFHKDALVTSDVSGQGPELLRRGRKTAAMERFTAMSNILAVRWRGFDPEGILTFLNRWTWWVFTPTAVVITLILGAIALLSVLVNFAAFQSRLPGFDAFFDPTRWVMFGAVLCITKVIHEFGHGLSCKRLGGECHEIGFMLLVLTPCLYCNVSDSWRLPNKWHRAAIGAAGMYVEIILATIATFIWWFVEPGWVQDVCLQVMLISSISTVLFNGNPLLRFDGYYILSDILEIPNMYQKSTKSLTTLLGRHWLGLEIPDDSLMPTNRPWAFAMYTVAAFLYRWVILFSIVTFLIIWLEPYGLESVGKGIAIFAGVGMLVWPSYRLFKYMSVPGRMHQIEKMRFSVITAIGLVLIALILFVPFPSYLRCDLIMVPREMETIYVMEPGLLQECHVENGSTVKAGDKIATLKNLDLEIFLKDAKSQLSEKISERKTMLTGASALGGAEYFNKISTIDSEIAQLRKIAAQLDDRIGGLEITSKISGTVLETPYQSGAQGEEVDQQPFLTGKNKNVSAMKGQRFCEVADLSSWHAIILLTEDQIKFAEAGKKAKIKLYAEPGRVIESEVESIGIADQSINREEKNTYLPDPSGGRVDPGSQLPDLVTEMVSAANHNNIQYFARVPLDPGNLPMKIGMGGQARLFIANRSLASRLWWWFNQNFRS